MKSIFLSIILLAFISCKQTSKPKRVVVIQPFEDFSPKLTSKVLNHLSKIHEKTILRKPIAIPESAYYEPRNRYKATRLIEYLGIFGSADTVIIGLTNKDISVTKTGNQDYGIMGLGYLPGKACVVSTYRLRKKNLSEQFLKLSVHELGHTQGLPHCPNESCFMRDAKGKNVYDEEKDFCFSCKSFLKKKGWKIS